MATAQDSIDENNETFTVTLTVTSGTARVADGTATGTITDDDQAAGAPIGLIASPGSGEGEIHLSWNNPSNTGVLNGADPVAVTSYEYRLAESSGALPSAPWTTAGTATNYTVSGLAGGTAYYFQVRALNGVTPEGEASTEARGTPVDPRSRRAHRHPGATSYTGAGRRDRRQRRWFHHCPESR